MYRCSRCGTPLTVAVAFLAESEPEWWRPAAIPDGCPCGGDALWAGSTADVDDPLDALAD